MLLSVKKSALVILYLLVNTVPAAPPVWWSDGASPVIDPLLTENNRGPANIGQAKHIAKSAIDTLREILPEVAAEIENSLSLVVDLTIPDYKTQEWLDKQKAPLLIGQLKAISDPFYNTLHAVAPKWLEGERTMNGTNRLGSIFPWTIETIDDENKSLANIGQLKAVFSLRFGEDCEKNPDGISDLLESYLVSLDKNDNWTDIAQINSSNVDPILNEIPSRGSPPAAPRNLQQTVNPDGSITFTWDDNSTNEEAFTIERILPDGSVLLLGTVPANSTSFTYYPQDNQ